MGPGESWPAALQPYLDLWRLTPEHMLGQSPWSLVARVRRDGVPLVLKVVDPDSDEMRGPDLLAHFAGHGTVRLLAREGPASLIECATPGRPLAALVAEGRDAEATRILCTTAAALHAAPPTPVACPTVEALAGGFARIRDHPRAGTLGRDTIDRAAGLYADLAATQGQPVVLHGDLHHENVLWDEARGWRAIDPKGVRAEPAYEMGAALRNPITPDTPAADPATMARRVDIMTETLGLDRSRILGWCAAQAVLAAIWSIEDGLGRQERLDHWRAVEACARQLLSATS